MGNRDNANITLLGWVACLSVLGFAMASPAGAQLQFTINNPTLQDFDLVTDVTYTLPPGYWSVPLPSSPYDVTIRSKVVSPFEDSSFFEFESQISDGDAVAVQAMARPWGIPDHLVVDVYAGAVLQASSDSHASDSARDVQFLGTADCQYWWDSSNGDQATYNMNSNQVFGSAFQRLDPASPSYRGLIIAGDLLQDTRVDEISMYDGNIAGNERFVYDGVGNHDLHWTGDDFLEDCWYDPDLDACSDPSNIIGRIVGRNHTTVKTKQSNFPVNQFESSTVAPLYSWDWHDVHFVQLGMVPGMGNSQGPLIDELPCGVFGENCASGDPFPTFDSLSFLTNDLAANVGSSGRPVVLIHHYDLAGSDGDFTLSERVAYWNAIRDYNVVAILAGHLHPAASHGWKYRWYRPSGATGGPSYYETFVIGAARGTPTGLGAFTELSINGANQIKLVRRDEADNTVGSPHIYEFGDTDFLTAGTQHAPLHVDTNDSSPGAGYGQANTPFKSLSQAVDAIDSRFVTCKSSATDMRCNTSCQDAGAVPCSLPTEIQIKPGDYGDAVTLSYSADVGPVTINAVP